MPAVKAEAFKISRKTAVKTGSLRRTSRKTVVKTECPPEDELSLENYRLTGRNRDMDTTMGN